MSSLIAAKRIIDAAIKKRLRREPFNETELVGEVLAAGQNINLGADEVHSVWNKTVGELINENN